jgi:hypothetical protein
MPSYIYPREGYGGDLVLYDIETKERKPIASGMPLWNPRVHWRPIEQQ